MSLKNCLQILLSIFFSTTVLSQENVKSVTAVRTGTPVIDGIFNDQEWVNGGKAEGFVQMNPVEGEPSTEKTEVYFLYDDENLYVGVKCFAKEPDKIVKQITGRDNQGSSDWFEIHLDTFHDHRNAYLFVTTPGGAKCDGKYSKDGDNEDWSWDGVWWVKTNVTDYGWIAEYKIPFSTLKFPKKEKHMWGLNILRWISNKNEWTSWQQCKRNDGIKMSKDGHLEGLERIKPGMNLEILPYLTSRGQKDRIKPFKLENNNGITGIDMKYGITTNLTATLTINPDFAQIEADEDLINLTRYPLYLPEKRPFFTEGASNFQTAGSGHNSGLFYSRRINEPVYGLKVEGKIGNWHVGVLHTLNDNDKGIQNKIENEELPQDSKTDAFYNVIRVSRDVFSRSQVGFIAIDKEYSGGYNRIFGFDGNLRFKNFYTFSYEAVKSLTNDYNDKNHSVNMSFSRNADFFSFSTSYNEQAPNFMGNDAGFYSYNNYRRAFLGFNICPRIEKIGIRQLFFINELSGENFWSNKFFDKEKLTREMYNHLSITFMNYWGVHVYKSVGKAYDRFDNVLYPTDGYHMCFHSNTSKPVLISFSHNQGKYRTGYSWSYYNSARIRASGRVNIELSYRRSLAKLVNTETQNLDHHKYEVWRSKLNYCFNTDLNTRVIFQYSGMEKRLDTYYLLAYNFRPKSFLYIAYTERFDETSFIDNAGIERFPKFSSSNKILQIKLSYLFLR